MGDMNKKTVGGLLAYCDWLSDKGYQSASATKAWKTATTKVFEAVDGEEYESVSLEGLDLDDHIDRFRTLAGAQYKAESITVYRKRVLNAIEAHQHYLEHGKPPTFRKAAPRKKTGSAESPEKKPTTTPEQKQDSKVVPIKPLQDDYFELDYPLTADRSVYMRLPKQMTQREIDRLCAVIKTLEEVPQIPEQTGQAA